MSTKGIVTIDVRQFKDKVDLKNALEDYISEAYNDIPDRQGVVVYVEDLHFVHTESRRSETKQNIIMKSDYYPDYIYDNDYLLNADFKKPTTKEDFEAVRASFKGAATDWLDKLICHNEEDSEEYTLAKKAKDNSITDNEILALFELDGEDSGLPNPLYYFSDLYGINLPSAEYIIEKILDDYEEFLDNSRSSQEECDELLAQIEDCEWAEELWNKYSEPIEETLTPEQEIKAMAEAAPDDINLEEELAKMEAEQGQTRQRELGM